MKNLFRNATNDFKRLNPRLVGGEGKGKNTGVLERQRGLLRNHETPNRSQIPNTESKPDQAPALDSAVQGKAKSVSRIRVRFVGYRVRPLDPDNFAGSCKDLLDGLRHAGLISGDEPWRISFETEQEKVSSYDQEQTVIEIETVI